MRREKRVLRLLAEAARFLLLVISLLAVGTAAAWVWQPAAINRVDAHLTNRRSDNFQTRFNQAKRRCREDLTVGVALLEELIFALDGVRRGDRLYPVKRDSVQLLVDVLSAEEQWPAALAWSHRWVQWDEQDISAAVALARAQLHTPGAAGDGHAALKQKFEVVPESDAVAAGYVQCLVEAGQPADAFLAIQKYLSVRQGRANGECEFWCVPQVGPHKFRTAAFLHDDGRWHWMVELEAGARGIHIRLPKSEVSTLQNPELVIWNSSTEHTVTLSAAAAELSDSISGDSQTWVIAGYEPDEAVSASDAIASWTIPDEFSDNRIVVSLAAHVVPRYPDWIERAVGLPDFTRERIESDTRATRRPSFVAEFRSLQQSIFRQSWFGVHWRQGQVDRLEWAPSASVLEGDCLHFDVRIPVGASQPRLRLQLPGVSGMVFRFADIEFIGETAAAIDLRALEPVSGVNPVADGLRINSAPAIVSLPVPEGPGRIDWVRLVGIVE